MMRMSLLLNLKIPRFETLRHCHYKTKKYKKVNNLNNSEHLDQLIKKFAPKLIYNSIVENKIVRAEYLRRKTRPPRRESVEPLPVTLKYLCDEVVPKEKKDSTEEKDDETLLNFPYQRGYGVETLNEPPSETRNIRIPYDIAEEASEEVQKRYDFQKEMKTWMGSYDNYDDSLSCEKSEDEEVEIWKINYGTPDPRNKISKTPCGGCGALLHCKDTAIPGYIPSEIFNNSFIDGGVNLESVICQRCHFLKNYNVALQVQVTPEDYPKVLKTVSQRGGLVILMVDLLDFPCSIWPGIGEIFGSRTPIVIVGNKVDLLPQDSKNFLKHIRETLVRSMKLEGFATFNIKEVALISAKTGYGIEDLITKLNSISVKGDVYIVGCTNVGKSSLFNIFLQSDFCKVQAIDLIQRATTSVWPGTTLNLLRFPIKRPSGYRQYLRHKRLALMQRIEVEERNFRKQQLKITKDPKFATLIGHIDVTKTPEAYMDEDRNNEWIALESQEAKFGVNEKNRIYMDSKWCYDTPGVIQPDQIINLLTTEELLLTLPKEIILPRTFCVKPNSALFIAGLARLDYIDGPSSVRLTVFASNELPITVCKIEDAEELYGDLLGTELFKVPRGNAERFSKWPKLEMAKEFKIVGDKWREGINDVVLSSAGWISLTGKRDMEYTFKAWTPEKRGVYLRDCLLPHAVALAGGRIGGSIAYHKFKFFTR